MADDNDPSPPVPSFPAVQSAPSPVPPAVENVTTAPAFEAPPAAPAFSAGDFVKGLLRSALDLLIGAAVGAAAGFILNYVLIALDFWKGDVRIATGAGLLFGVFFNRFIVHTLHLAPRKELQAREAAANAPARAAVEGPPPDSFREIIETVVFVVVLVLLLKSFAAEAFVIPTGSMAETLLGYQKMAVCPKCGYRFPVNCSQQVDPSEGSAEPVVGCTCPNCREHIDFVAPGRKTDDPNAIEDPSWNSGDRVLVAKFVYDLFEAPPDRLDVVVFKFPGGSPQPFPISGPFHDGVPMNYIKRLCGLSGETIAIHDGDLYALPAPDQKMEDDVRKQLKEELKRDPTPDEMHDQLVARFGRLAYYDLEKEPDPAKREELFKQLWERKYTHQNDAQSLELFRNGSFQIIRKSPDNILAMRRIVYDNDHPATDLVGLLPPRWAGRANGAAWTADDAHGFRLSPPSDPSGVHWLGYRHLLRDRDMRAEDMERRKLAEKLKREPTTDEMREQMVKHYEDEKPELITDFMGYNTWEAQDQGGRRIHHWPDENWAGDLILDCEVQPDQPQGELTLEVCRGVDRFRARWDLSTGVCTLLRVQDGKEETLESKPTGLKGGATHKVRFANVDQRLTVWVDEALPFGDGVTYPPARVEGPTPENDLEPANIGLKNVGGAVRGLKLWRDTYYTTQNNGSPSSADAVGAVDFARPDTWGPLGKQPTKTLYVQPRHYLCLGDNSPESSDGRSWGLVPERLLLGKALAVYYPFDRFGRIR